MGFSAHQVEIWQRERQLTDVLETIALVVRVITAQAGITLPNLEPRKAPESCRLRLGGRDQRWRGAPPPAAVDLSA